MLAAKAQAYLKPSFGLCFFFFFSIQTSEFRKFLSLWQDFGGV
jgi:hypothetical protein